MKNEQPTGLFSEFFFFGMPQEGCKSKLRLLHNTIPPTIQSSSESPFDFKHGC